MFPKTTRKRTVVLRKCYESQHRFSPTGQWTQMSCWQSRRYWTVACFVQVPDMSLQILRRIHLHLHLSLNRKGRRGTTDDFAISFVPFSLFFTALCHSANSRSVHSLMLSSHLCFCGLPRLLLPFTAPCKIVSARPDERETRPLPPQFASRLTEVGVTHSPVPFS